MRLPDCPFYLFGMGDRAKLLYKGGLLLDALTGQPLHAWRLASENILPSDYRVELVTTDDKQITIREDEQGLWLETNGDTTCLSESKLTLPRFEGHPHSPLLRIAHHDILVNLLHRRPLPNFFVYPKPWYRDAATMCMCLEETGNLALVADWIRQLRAPFDRNNAGNCEPDNLGQALYLISLVSDRSHPLVETVLRALPEFAKARHLVGPTDGAEHPVYQTKWLKLGLRRLGLDDPYHIPEVFDSYSSLFWMDYRDAHMDGPRFSPQAEDLYPYLGWAEAHFYQEPPPMHLVGERYPLTWEAQASEASYQGMAAISPDYVNQRICAPHAWHAAEMLLYLWDPVRGSRTDNTPGPSA